MTAQNTIPYPHSEQAIMDKLQATTRLARLSSLTDPYNNDDGACLVRIYPPSIGEGIINLPQEDVVLGRSKGCDVVLDDPAVSRQHSFISYTKSGYRITDLGSFNSTIVNDKKVSRSRLLKPGDLIRIGHMVFKYLSSDHVERQYHEEIYSMMITDGLTGIPNKRYFMEMFEREFNRARRHRRPLCLLMFDIDNFKIINDTYGHLVGDYILRDLCARISPYIRGDEIFARYGGEEFAVVLSEVKHEQARVFGEKIRTVVSSEDFDVDDFEIPITVSIGIAELDGRRHKSALDLIKAVDRKLYIAKDSGRDCLVG
jgi:diguanylate cyclase (GGDEF)-like protein